jgi:hypothetical protein
MHSLPARGPGLAGLLFQNILNKKFRPRKKVQTTGYNPIEISKFWLERLHIYIYIIALEYSKENWIIARSLVGNSYSKCI